MKNKFLYLMKLIDLIQSYNVFTLLCVNNTDDVYKKNEKDMLIKNVLERILEASNIKIDKAKILSKEEQTRLIKNYPIIKKNIVRVSAQCKLEKLRQNINKLKARISKDKDLAWDDQYYYRHLIRNVELLLKKSLFDEILSKDKEDLSLFCNKFNKYSIL